MTGTTPPPEPTTAADALRERLRSGLVEAMKQRRPEAVTALRTALAALDNAEAVPVDGTRESAGSSRIAGATSGVGATEASRRRLSHAEVTAILRAQVTERRTEARTYETHGRPDAAARLRTEADALARYLEEESSDAETLA